MKKITLLFLAAVLTTTVFAQNIQALQIPARPDNAMGGAEFMQSLIPLSLAAREEAIFREATKGNIPNAFRQMARITTTRQDANGVNHQIVLEVMPDFLAIGSDEDFYRIPLLPMTAQRIANAFGAILPTTIISDLAWQYAEIRINPWDVVIPWTNRNVTVPSFIDHNQMIEARRIPHGKPASALIAGHKKDIVITNRIFTDANGLTRVFIYGWHQTNGTPIQPLSAAHDLNYVDYSHGVRLVNQQMTINGVTRNVRDVLRDPVLFRLISREAGIMRITEYGGEVYPPLPVSLELVLGRTPNAPYTPLLTAPYTIYVGETVHLGIRISGSNTWESRLNFTLTSSDTNVASISTAGEIRALAAGTTTIKAVRNSGGAESEIRLTVMDNALERPDNFPQPEQDEHVVAQSFYNFYHHTTLNAPWMKQYTIRRAIHRHGQLYVLTQAPNPKILIVNPKTLEIIREKDLTGVSGGLNGFTLSDIAFTADGKLLATNLAVVSSTTRDENTTGAPRLRVYIWDNDNAQPRIFYELWRNASAPAGSHEAMLGNYGNGFWNAGRLGETMAVSGPSWDATIYMPSFSANEQTGVGETFRMVAHVVRNGVLVQTCYRMRVAGTSPDAGGNPFDAPNNFGGTGFQLNISPFADDRLILKSRAHAPTEFHWNWNEHRRSALHRTTTFAKENGFSAIEIGANYFRFADRIFMAAPMGIASTGSGAGRAVFLLDVTNGLNNAVTISEILGADELDLVPTVGYVKTFGVVHNEHIALYLLSQNQGFVRFATYQPGLTHCPEFVTIGNLRVFPNPVSDVLNIYVADDFEINSIQLLDMSGRSIRQFAANQRLIHLSDLSAGTYILLINNRPIQIIKQ